MALLFIFSSVSARADDDRHDLPRWEVGAGFGSVRFEQYPASDQYTSVTLPFPTFRYRGNILRADDREGARIYLLKKSRWRIHLGGMGLPPVKAGQARAGMSDIPTLGAIGPQLSGALTDDLTFRLGAYQALAVTWLAFRPSGVMGIVDMAYRKSHAFAPNFLGIEETSGSLTLAFLGASQEVHELYYGVAKEYVTAERSAYQARAGMLQARLSYFQSFKKGNLALYLGGRFSDFRISANRSSPLYKADRALSVLAGITYSIYQSKQEGVRQEDASGFMDMDRRRLQPW